VPHAGCPHDCVFCNQVKITGVEKPDISHAKQIIEDHLKSIPKSDESVIEIAFFGGSFTGIAKEIQIQYLELAHGYIQAGLIDGIRLSTRPDYIDRDILDLLSKYQVTTIELGVQSLDAQVLKKSNRGHTLSHVRSAVELIKGYSFNLGLQMMLGLPGDTKARAIKTAEQLIDMKADFVRIYPTLIIKDTDLETMYHAGVYQPLSIDEAVDHAAACYKLFASHNIPVIRMGLQPTDELNADGYIAGPYHPAFRQLVESKVYLDLLDEFFKKHPIEGDVKIHISSKELSYLVGQKRSNLNQIEAIYKINKIRVYSKERSVDSFQIVIKNQIFQVYKMTTISDSNMR